MTAVRPSVRVVVVLLGCLALIGCGSGDADPGADANGGGLEPAGAPVDEEADGEAIASPLEIPDWTERGRPLTDARWQRLEAKFADACGGELCVDLELRPDPEGTPREWCRWTSFDPPEGGTVERGGTVWVICEAMTEAERDAWGDQG